MNIAFTKMQGTGNDFVVIDDWDAQLDLSANLVSRICDRHFGVGADGLILARPSEHPDADAFMLYYNADGTTAEMCGNGIRCFAKYLVDNDICEVAADDSLQIDTLDGVKGVVCMFDEDGLVKSVCVDMGTPSFEPADVPVNFITDSMKDPLIDQEVSLSFGTFTITAVSMGNPHCILWVDDPRVADVEGIGSQLECSPLFPERTNVEFASVRGGHITLRVWERGVGETLACGTGACATAVAAAFTGRSPRNVVVELPGGELEVQWAQDDHVFMTGPAATVFIGEFNLNLFK